MYNKSSRFHFSNPFLLLFIVSFVALVAIQGLNAASARADCTYGGKTYKTGQTRGPYICMPNGKWQRR